MRKFVYYTDVHSFDSIKLDGFLKFVKHFKPDVLINGGDFLDFNQISKYTAKKRHNNINETIKSIRKEFAWGRKTLDRVDSASGNKCNKVYIIGNHEERLNLFNLEYPQYDSLSLDGELGLSKRGYKVIEWKKFYKLGHLYFGHGDGFTGKYYTKNIADEYRKNVRVGHMHTNQENSITSPLCKDEIYTVKGIGCLCNKCPEYVKRGTNRWINSFLYGYVLPNGDFQDFTVNIIKGKFIVEGKQWK